MQTITPFLWFNGQAEEATTFYLSIFKNSKLISTMPGPGGSVMGTTFELEGQRFHTLNGGPQYKFTPAISMFISVESQQEVDDLWSKLLAGGGREDMCGWLQDKYGLSWQVVPTALPRLLGDKNRTKAGAALQAMMTMRKIVIADLQKAFDAA